MLRSAGTVDGRYSFAGLVGDAGPAVHVPTLDLWLISGYQTCVDVLARSPLFSSREALSYGHALRNDSVRRLLRHGPGYPRVQTLVFSDPPEHGRYRALVESVFSPVARAGRMTSAIQSIVDRLIDDLATRDRCDFVADFASPLPLAVIGEILGLPLADLPRLRSWSDAFVHLQMGVVHDEQLQACAEAVLDFERYIADALGERRHHPRDDLLTRLVRVPDAHGRELSDRELISLLQQLLVGGNETTRNFLTSAVWRLATDHALRDYLVANPRQIPRAAEELLRLEAPLQGVFRIATHDTTVGGSEIPAGAKVMVLLGAANQDPARFHCGIDLEHNSAGSHLAFGSGIHHCIGASLARLEIRIALTRLLCRLPGISLDKGQQLERAPLIAIRGFTHLWSENRERMRGARQR